LRKGYVGLQMILDYEQLPRPRNKRNDPSLFG